MSSVNNSIGTCRDWSNVHGRTPMPAGPRGTGQSREILGAMMDNLAAARTEYRYADRLFVTGARVTSLPTQQIVDRLPTQDQGERYRVHRYHSGRPTML